MLDDVIKKFKSKLDQAQTILLLTHKDPDGDACGAMLAMYLSLTSLGKQVSMLTANAPASYYAFLPKIELISQAQSDLDQAWDLVMILDCGDFKHTGLPVAKLQKHMLVNIDHHQSNQNFGTYNIVDASYSSTCELVYTLLTQSLESITQPMANCLLTGIMTDTGGFNNAATSAQSLQVAADLVARGAKLSQITGQITKNKSIAGLRVWGILFSRLCINKQYNLAYTYIWNHELEQYHVNQNEIDGFVNFLNVIADVTAAFFLRLDENQVKVSMRTKRDDVNLSDLAQIFGGGGHQKAAGFTVDWQMTSQQGKLQVI